MAGVKAAHGMCDYVDGGELVAVTTAPLDVWMPGGVASSLLFLLPIRAGADCRCDITKQLVGPLLNAVQRGNRCYVDCRPRTSLKGRFDAVPVVDCREPAPAAEF